MHANTSATGTRWAVAALDHAAAALGYAAVPDASPYGGGWRRLYVKEGAPTLAAVGPEGGAWVGVGVEWTCPRDRVAARAVELLEALSPFEVAVDPDAGADRMRRETVVRVALRLFVEGLHPAVVREAVGNLVDAAAEARRVLGV
jgi:hypothetical protein